MSDGDGSPTGVVTVVRRTLGVSQDDVGGSEVSVVISLCDGLYCFLIGDGR